MKFCKSKIKQTTDLEQDHGGSIVNCLPKSQPPECESLIINEAMMHVLSQHLPMGVREPKKRLIYCVNRDGYSHHTFFRNTQDQDYSLLIVQDSLGHAFGAFLSS